MFLWKNRKEKPLKREGMDTEKSLKKTIWRFMVILCLIVFAVSVFGIVGTLLKANREKSTFDDLIEMAEADVGAEQGNIDSDAVAEMQTTEVSEEGQTNSEHIGGVMEEKPKRNYGLLKERILPGGSGFLIQRLIILLCILLMICSIIFAGISMGKAL